MRSVANTIKDQIKEYAGDRGKIVFIIKPMQWLQAKYGVKVPVQERVSQRIKQEIKDEIMMIIIKGEVRQRELALVVTPFQSFLIHFLMCETVYFSYTSSIKV